MLNRRTVGAASAWLLLLGPMLLPAGAVAPMGGQMDARSQPTVTGPLIVSNESYSGKPCRKEGSTSGGVATASIRYCRTFLRFEPGAETDASRDYGVWWIQATVKPLNGWCVSRATTVLSMGEAFEATNFVESDERLKAKQNMVVTLSADAGGSAVTPASVSNTLIAYKGTYRSGWKADTNTFKVTWRGSSSRKVALAGGIEGYWDAGSGPGVFLPGAGAEVTKPC